MIPIRLTLRQFLSYEYAVLDFSSLHTACICGENGAGKSSLFEGLTWALWGQTRVPVEPDLIRQGATEMQVELLYRSFGQVYRVLRSRHINRAGMLEWQIQTGDCWRSLTQKGMRATQKAIQTQLRLDYETFVNSAYLRQGRADEFTLKRPGDRKRILAEILNLGRYETLAEGCRERVRTAKAQLRFQQQHLEQLAAQLQGREGVRAESEQLQVQQAKVAQQQERLQTQLEQVEARDRQWETIQQQVEWQQHQLDTLKLSLQRTEKQWRQSQQQVSDLSATLDRAADIECRYYRYESLLAQERTLQSQQQKHLSHQQQHQQLRAQLAERQHQHSLATEKLRAQLDHLRTALDADKAIAAEGDRIATAVASFRQAHATLEQLDRLQARATPLLEQQHVYQRQIRQERERLVTRQESLQRQVERYAERERQRQHTQQAVAEVSLQLDELAKLRVYQLRVQEKKQERQAFLEHLHARQRIAQRQWQQLGDRLHQLEHAPKHTCPTCDRELDDDSHARVIDKHQAEREDWADELWTIREQLAATDREIATFDDENDQIEQQLNDYDTHVCERGRLQAHLETDDRQSQQHETVRQELLGIDRALAEGGFATDAQSQLAAVERSLAELNYDEKDHALCRSEVNRGRWAAAKQSECDRARHRLADRHREIAALEAQLTALSSPKSPITREIEATNARCLEVERALATLDYDEALHAHIRAELTRKRQAQLQWEALQRARKDLPRLQTDCATLKQTLHQQRHAFHEGSKRLERDRQTLTALERDINSAENNTLTTANLRASLQANRQELDLILDRVGATRQHLQHLAALSVQHRKLQQQCQQTRRQVHVYQELARAYGHNGIPASIVERALPELEAEANRILGQLTHNQLHLHFVTQRSGRRQGTTIDTLDILIADPRGSRPYETYSGGEAFRINFAIRLALSRFMTQRAGTRLQTLLIDEGFGTQDATGRELLVSAINAVANDFACLLAITHLPTLRDRFPSRIQVERSAAGSTLQVLA
ncbi:MAG: SMC family ATPase [Cyanobacteria bacterium P01_D01_bin.123]